MLASQKGQMDIENLRIFARVAAVRNLSQVGREFGVTPGTISKKLQTMEDELGVRLFDRTTRSIRITDEGEVLLPFADEIVAELDSAKAKIDETLKLTRGRLRVCAPARFGGIDTASCICGFIEKYPDVEVFLESTDLITNGDAFWDLAIKVGNLSDSTNVAQRLADDTQVVVAAPSYLEKTGQPNTPDGLANHNCLCSAERTQWTFKRDGKSHTVRVQGDFVCADERTLQTAALLGRGILRTSMADINTYVQSGRLIQILGSYDATGKSGVWAVYPSSRYNPPRLRAFVGYVREALRGPKMQEDNDDAGDRKYGKQKVPKSAA